MLYFSIFYAPCRFDVYGLQLMLPYWRFLSLFYPFPFATIMYQLISLGFLLLSTKYEIINKKIVCLFEFKSDIISKINPFIKNLVQHFN